jgi:hypothetical protein
MAKLLDRISMFGKYHQQAHSTPIGAVIEWMAVQSHAALSFGFVCCDR